MAETIDPGNGAFSAILPSSHMHSWINACTHHDPDSGDLYALNIFKQGGPFLSVNLLGKMEQI
jgi:hypothetical protein